MHVLQTLLLVLAAKQPMPKAETEPAAACRSALLFYFLYFICSIFLLPLSIPFLSRFPSHSLTSSQLWPKSILLRCPSPHFLELPSPCRTLFISISGNIYRQAVPHFCLP
ncbi:hypothetical protein AVEN_71357-1 [Araneus ventricosus]|uniref:Secreted protein n=1 Tax=Araneus ventricosus TaxID=182803 RepID=A0A4Y2BIE7_ARAVE|nr:hypothetical protein AVEN_71357-1 [Araneus ventricosus]